MVKCLLRCVAPERVLRLFTTGVHTSTRRPASGTQLKARATLDLVDAAWRVHHTWAQLLCRALGLKSASRKAVPWLAVYGIGVKLGRRWLFYLCVDVGELKRRCLRVHVYVSKQYLRNTIQPSRTQLYVGISRCSFHLNYCIQFVVE